MSTGRLRIVVSGYAVTYPFGGVFWDYVQYVLGCARLGHDVLYIEDTGRWVYDPVAETFVEDAQRNVAAFASGIDAVAPEVTDRWFVRDAAGRTYGRPWTDVAAFCRSADLFLNLSMTSIIRDEYLAARAVAYVDSDPMYTQGTAEHWNADEIEALRRRCVFFTFAENIGAPECRVPSGLFRWVPTRQPVVLDCWRPARLPVASRRRVLTTIASWEPSERGPVVDGVRYGGKSREFERFIDLPSRSRLPIELGLSGPAPLEHLRRHHWRIVDGYGVSRDPSTYRRYLASSWGEWSVAKHAYVASRSGWFSCRTACYLALGVPAIVQDTGFETTIPAGRGVLRFATLDEAVGAVEDLVADPELHSAAAVDIAREYFDSDRVLGQLIDQALDAQTTR
jgi:hypothetical protein